MVQYFEDTLTVSAEDLAETLEHEGREAFDERLDDVNDESRENAQDAFVRKVGDEFEENCTRLAADLDERLRQLREGRPPRRLGAFDRDDMVRILATCTVVFYDVYEYNPEEGDKAAAAQNRPKTTADDIWLTQDVFEVYEAEAREAFLRSLHAYLVEESLAAATYHNEEAHRLYREASDLVETAYANRSLDAIPSADALRALECERQATECLLDELSGGPAK